MPQKPTERILEFISYPARLLHYIPDKNRVFPKNPGFSLLKLYIFFALYNIAIAGLEAKRKYDITFDTKKSPGKICIELKRHEIYSLDGWLFTGTPVKMDKTYENGGDWPANEADGALPLKKNGNNWIVENVTLKEGWNGFKLCTPEWTDEIGWSQVAYSENDFQHYGDFFAGGFGYALDDDDVIMFRDTYSNNWKGTETGTLTFTIVNGLIQIESNIDEPN